MPVTEWGAGDLRRWCGGTLVGGDGETGIDLIAGKSRYSRRRRVRAPGGDLPLRPFRKRPMSHQLVEVIQRLGEPHILVLGDVILDRYVWGDAERISQEAPVILLREDSNEIRLGGAANVARMLRGLDAKASIASVTGSDADAGALRGELEASGVNCELLVDDPARPTTVKVRYMGRAQNRHPHQILRVDREVRTPVAGSVADQIWGKIAARLDEFDAVLISDYAKGVCTEELCQRVIGAARKRGIPVIADPSSTGQCDLFRGATALTPNRLETSRAVGHPIQSDQQAFAAGKTLVAENGLDFVFVTLDSDGIAVVRNSGDAVRLPTRKRQVYDITGAGDTVLAMIGIGAAAGIDAENLARLANIAGGLEVEKIGCVPISRDEMLADLVAHHQGGEGEKTVRSLEELGRHVAARKRIGQKVVFTNGCFDLLHPGHARFLREARQLGDLLVVAINSDRSVRELKGPTRPVVGQVDRADMLAALGCVDFVYVFDEATPLRSLEVIRPDVLVKGGTTPVVVGRELVESYGGVVTTLGETPGFSTTKIISGIQEQNRAA